MSLLELIGRADERALAAGALACLDRCLPLLGGSAGPQPLRPLWASCEDGREWATRLAVARAAVEGGAPVTDGPAVLVRAMFRAAPSDFAATPLREWADACSLAALRVHGGLDAPGEGPPRDEERLLELARKGGPAAVGPLVAGELERQVRVLEVLAETGGTTGSGAGLRKALDLSTEGRRILCAVMSRRARGRG
ncbi:hypothetical protein [Streptomyces pratensis]|uniref:hypothetical protein n=1 Tax=Streptomyces pratensis TaxID=1169025 RepID=UPI0030181963